MNNANMVNDNFGFVDVDGHFRNANFPTGTPASPPVDQLLGVNDRDVAVGFYTDANGNNHGYEYNIGSSRFSTVTDPSLPGASLTAAAINDEGDVAGFYTNCRRHHRRVPQDAPRAVHRPGGSRRGVHHGAGRQRLG